MRWCSLPGLCRHASLRPRLSAHRLDPSRLVAIVCRVCRVPLFSLPIFPRACMRQSLALYRELTRMGYAATIHFGVRREGARISGHSWVTLDGIPLAESHPVQPLSVTYSYSAAVIQSR